MVANNGVSIDFDVLAEGASVDTASASPDAPYAVPGSTGAFGGGKAKAVAAYNSVRGVEHNSNGTAGTGTGYTYERWFLNNLASTSRMSTSFFGKFPTFPDAGAGGAGVGRTPIFQNSGGWSFYVTSTGGFKFYNGTTLLYTSSTLMSTNTWYYFEIAVTGGASGRLEFNYYRADTSALIESYDSGAGGVTIANHNFFTDWGCGNSNGGVADWIWYGDRFILDIKPGVGSYPAYSHNFELGTSGSNMTTSILSKPGHALDAVTPGASSTITTTTSAVSAMHGTSCLRFNFAANDTGYVSYTIYSEAVTRRYATRAYVQFSSVGSSAETISSLWNSTAGAGFVGVTSTGVWKITDAAGTIPNQASVGPTANTWYRVEFAITPGTTTSNGIAEWAIYAGDSSTAVWSGTNSAFNAGTTALATARWGRAQSNTYVARNVYMDDISVAPLSAGFLGTSIAATGSTGGQVKVWNGSSWAAKPVKEWTGTAWVQKPLKRWTGTSWVPTNY